MVALPLPRARTGAHRRRPRIPARRHRRDLEPSASQGETVHVTAAVHAPERTGTVRETLVELRGLSVAYDEVLAVDNVDLTIGAGEIVGLAGESGCGKSTVANTVMQILRPPARIVGGSVLFRGEDLTARRREQLR